MDYSPCMSGMMVSSEEESEDEVIVNPNRKHVVYQSNLAELVAKASSIIGPFCRVVFVTANLQAGIIVIFIGLGQSRA